MKLVDFTTLNYCNYFCCISCKRLYSTSVFPKESRDPTSILLEIHEDPTSEKTRRNHWGPRPNYVELT